MFYGLLNLSFWSYCVLTLVLTQLTVLSITIFLHRGQAHRSLDIHPMLAHVFRFWLWMSTGMETKKWVAIHRKHHAHCETEEDPHSPQILGLRTVLWQGAELYRKEGLNQATLEKFGKGTPNDWIERHLYSRFPALGLLFMLLLDLALLGVPGIIVWGIQMAWTPFWAAGIINGLAHYWGYRNYECADAARNLTPLAIFIGGEELHNNHHTFGTSAKFSVKWWEFDIGWLFIRIFSFFRLIKVKRVATSPQVVQGKSQVDLETLSALVRHRFQILSTYSKDVIMPIFHQECESLKGAQRRILTRVKNSLIRAEEIMSSDEQAAVKGTLLSHQRLALVYDFRVKLQSIWSRTTHTQRELLEALQEWCKQAEEAGIEALTRFSIQLKTYVCSNSGYHPPTTSLR